MVCTLRLSYHEPVLSLIPIQLRNFGCSHQASYSKRAKKYAEKIPNYNAFQLYPVTMDIPG